MGPIVIRQVHIWIVLGCLALVLAVSRDVQAAQSDCQILYEVVPKSCESNPSQCTAGLAILNSVEKQPSIIEGTNAGSPWLLSPDQSMVAQEAPHDTTSDVKMFDLSATKPALLATIPHFMLASWSHDGGKLLLRNADNNEGIYSIYDVKTHSLVPIAQQLNVHKAAWSLDDKWVGFVADEFPFPKDETGLNSVLYIAQVGGKEYQRISQKSAETQDFIWLSDNKIIFRSCTNGNCQLNIANSDATLKKSIDGDYALVAKSPVADNILVISRDAKSSTSKLLILDPNSGQLTAIDDVSNNVYPVASWSPDGKNILYIKTVDGQDRISVIDIRLLKPQVINLPLDDFEYLGDWHPSGTRILLNSGTSPNNTFYEYELATHTLKVISPASLGGAARNPRWVCLNSAKSP
jgi:Tol biopolymer transport system component